MKICKILLSLLCGIILVGLFNIPVSAYSDTTDDLWNCGDEECEENTGSNYPNIDITDVSYTKNGLELTLSMTVSGTLQNSIFYMYMIYSGMPTGPCYYISYSEGQGIWGASQIEGVIGGNLTNPISSDGKTFSATITLVEDIEIFPYANSLYYENILDPDAHYYQDWYPNSYFEGGDINEDDNAGTSVEYNNKTDGTDDLMFYQYDSAESKYKKSAEGISDYPEIDITSIKASISGSTLTLEMTVDGPISSSMFCEYYLNFGTSDKTKYYSVYYSSYTDSAFYLDAGMPGETTGNLDDCLSQDKKTITVSFTIPKKDESYVVWGYSKKYLTFEESTSGKGDYYYDALNMEQTGSTGSNGSPGFELFALVTALAFIFLLRKTRK